MAEFSSETIQELAPNQRGGTPTRLVFVKGNSSVNSDVITVTDLTTVQGAFLIATDGTVGTMTFATNVITVTNAGAKAWSGLAWGT